VAHVAGAEAVAVVGRQPFAAGIPARASDEVVPDLRLPRRSPRGGVDVVVHWGEAGVGHATAQP
jgi:hypothetical protein